MMDNTKKETPHTRSNQFSIGSSKLVDLRFELRRSSAQERRH